MLFRRKQSFPFRGPRRGARQTGERGLDDTESNDKSATEYSDTVTLAKLVASQPRGALPIVAVDPMRESDDGVYFLAARAARDGIGSDIFKVVVEDAEARRGEFLEALRERKQVVKLFEDEPMLLRFCAFVWPTSEETESNVVHWVIVRPN